MKSSLNIQTANRACALLYSYVKGHCKGKYLLPVNVCPDVPLTLSLAGVDYDFIDINPHTLCIDEETCVRKFSKSTDYVGVIYIRTYGFLYDTTEFFSCIKSIRNNVVIIDDRCLCMPELTPNTYGADMVLYSTGHCKQIDLGGGGYCLSSCADSPYLDDSLFYDGTDEEALYKAAYRSGVPLPKIPMGWLKISQLGMSDKDYFSRIESLTLVRTDKRVKLNQIYRVHLPVDIQMPTHFQNWRFNIRVPSVLKERILTSLFNEGLFASSHYHSVNRLFNNLEFKNSDKLFSEVINLFNDNYYSEEQALLTSKIINKEMSKFTPPVSA